MLNVRRVAVATATQLITPGSQTCTLCAPRFAYYQWKWRPNKVHLDHKGRRATPVTRDSAGLKAYPGLKATPATPATTGKTEALAKPAALVAKVPGAFQGK